MPGWLETFSVGIILIAGIFIGMQSFQTDVVNNYNVSLTNYSANDTTLPNYYNNSQSFYLSLNDLLNNAVQSLTNPANLIFGVAPSLFVVIFKIPIFIFQTLLLLVTTIVNALGLPSWVLGTIIAISTIYVIFAVLKTTGVLKDY